MYSHQPPQLSNLSRSLPPTPSQVHPAIHHEHDPVPDDYFGDSEDVPLPFPIQTIVADPKTGLSLTLISALGAGSYAVVYLAREVASGALFALKCLGKDKLTEEEVDIQRNEVDIHTSLPKHRNIVHLFNMFETTHHLFLLLEYSSGMDMYQWISMRSDRADPISNEPYSDSKRYIVIKTLFDQVLEAVGQVHACGVAHRDLKPENFLIEFVDGQYTVKLTDFGLATTDSESDEFECGSKPYMSFECRNGLDATYNVKMADLWSLGIILINLLYHRCPWSDPCPQESFAFSEFIKSRVDFLQRRFEDMPGPVARWLALRSFAFVGGTPSKSRRTRSTIEEWKSWMVDFVPRMLGQTDSDVENLDEYDDQEEYRAYLELFEDDLLGREVVGEEILDNDVKDGEENDSDNQIVPIAIHPSSMKDKQYLHPDPGRAYASYHAPTDARMSSSFTSSSMPKFDPSAFYQPTRLRQESWSDAIDMEGTENAEMDFSTPILFEELEEDDNQHSDEEDDDDSAGLAMALPDDFIDPLPERSAASSGRQTPSTPTMTHLNFNPEKRQLPAHLRLDSDSPQEPAKRGAGRGSPGLELNDQINTLVFIEPDTSRIGADANQNAQSAGIASSLPSTSHMEANLGHNSAMSKERALLKQQMRKPTRNLQDVKAAPFVFPPLKSITTLGNPITDSAQSSTFSFQHKEKLAASQPPAPPSQLDSKGTESKEAPKEQTNKSNPYVIPKRSQLGPWAGPSTGSGSSRPSEVNIMSAGRNPNWRSHHRGGSWASIDDNWDNRRDSGSRRGNDGTRSSSSRWRKEKEDGHAGLPPRVENKFRPRYRQGRRLLPQPPTAALPPAPPTQHAGSSSAPRSRYQSRSGIVFDANSSNSNTSNTLNGPGAPLSDNEIYKPPSKETSNRNSFHLHHQQRQHPQEATHQASLQQPQQQQLKYEHSQLRMHRSANPGSSASRLSGQRNKSLVDLRAIDATNLPWRQLDSNSTPPVTRRNSNYYHYHNSKETIPSATATAILTSSSSQLSIIHSSKLTSHQQAQLTSYMSILSATISQFDAFLSPCSSSSFLQDYRSISAVDLFHFADSTTFKELDQERQRRAEVLYRQRDRTTQCYLHKKLKQGTATLEEQQRIKSKLEQRRKRFSGHATNSSSSDGSESDSTDPQVEVEVEVEVKVKVKVKKNRNRNSDDNNSDGNNSSSSSNEKNEKKKKSHRNKKSHETDTVRSNKRADRRRLLCSEETTEDKPLSENEADMSSSGSGSEVDDAEEEHLRFKHNLHFKTDDKEWTTGHHINAQEWKQVVVHRLDQQDLIRKQPKKNNRSKASRSHC
ncbi:hypothetical protein EDD11_004229 [Mortierella claussenii]|nr:hypothetical protein EDD11_004229 [Mortierella claussenii]